MGGTLPSWGEQGLGFSPGPASELLLYGLMLHTLSGPPDYMGQMATELPSSLPLPHWPNRVRMDPEIRYPEPFKHRVSFSLGSRDSKPRYRCGPLLAFLSPGTLKSLYVGTLT